MDALLTDGLSRLGISLSPEQIKMIDGYFGELMLWNGKYGLVNASPRDLIVKHFLDSFSAFPVLKEMEFGSACDAGSGGGFPGMAVAVLFPEKEFFLIERSKRKADFLMDTAAVIGAGNVHVLNEDAGNVKKCFDLVLFRALGQFGRYFPLLWDLAAENGHLFAFKGKRSEIDKELASVKNIKTRIVKASVPFLDEERNFVIMEKSAD